MYDCERDKKFDEALATEENRKECETEVLDKLDEIRAIVEKHFPGVDFMNVELMVSNRSSSFFIYNLDGANFADVIRLYEGGKHDEQIHLLSHGAKETGPESDPDGEDQEEAEEA